MFNGKFICTLAALIIAVFAICNFNSSSKSKVVEGLGMLPSMVVRPTMVARSKNGTEQAVQGMYSSTVRPKIDFKNQVDFYQTPANFQSSLSPRFGNTDFGANIRYNAPATKYMGVPKSPLGYANMVKENYGCSGSGCFSPSCGGAANSESLKSCDAAGPPLMPANYANGNYNAELDEAFESSQAPMMTDSLPVGNMTSLNNMGETTDNVVVYDRLMFANRNSTLRSQGDWIRGDLPITPCNTGWFQVSANPSIDLNQGAMNVLGGLDNGTSNQMAALINDYTGTTTIGGIDMTPQQLASVGASGRDVNVTAFP